MISCDILELNETEPSKLCIRSMAMIYDNGIFVNDQIGISATFSLVALGVSILGMVLQILAGILLFRGAAHIAKQEGLRGLAVAFRIVGACSLAFGGYSVISLIPVFRYLFVI